MDGTAPDTVLCLASYEKGADFLRECKRQGRQVILVTLTALQNAAWPRECIDEFFVMPDLSKLDEVTNGISYLARSRAIDTIVPLDDYDVEMAAALREHLRLPGMGVTLARHFRDKLAMRVRASQEGILVPDFVHTLNDAAVHAYMETVPAPWVLKPRSEVSTIGIARVEGAAELWPRLEALGDLRSFYLLERYIQGGVYHVDSIVYNGVAVFAEAHQYRRPPLEVFHGGGVSSSRTLPRGSEDEQTLLEANMRVVAALGMERGVMHTEFIKGDHDGRFYFLETGARVGGANTVEMVEAATGINLWVEWARIELTPHGGAYAPPTQRQDYGGVIISLARQEYPDTSAYTDPEIVWRLHKRHHVGFVLASADPARVAALLDAYFHRFATDFAAVMPPYTSRPSQYLSDAPGMDT